MADENTGTSHHASEPEETGADGMLGAAGSEPWPGLPEHTSPVGVPTESPSPGPGVPETATGSPSTAKGTDVLGTPGNVGRSRTSDVEPGTPGVPGTPTPGPTGYEPNTLDTGVIAEGEGADPESLDNAQRVLHGEGGPGAEGVRGKEGGLTGGSPQPGVGGGGHLVGGTGPGGATDDRFGTQVEHGGHVYPPRPPADLGTLELVEGSSAQGAGTPPGVKSGDAEARELLENAQNAAGTRTGARPTAGVETEDGQAFGQMDVPGGSGSDRPEPQNFNLPGTDDPYSGQP